ncbi:MAG: T9SS type A sorting domain-containing protein [Bacteroidota bacterium]|nr:T9SS type A sorting domain-containing protein [Bacteroidota bacterium]
MSRTESENLSVSITDISGKIVYSSHLVTSNFIGKLDFNLINGLYLITINNNNNESITKKLVIAK